MRRKQITESGESKAELAAKLERSEHRKLGDFIVAPDPGNHSDTKLSDAFWELVYWGIAEVDYDTANAIERELYHADATVGDFLNGRYTIKTLEAFRGDKSE